MEHHEKVVGGWGGYKVKTQSSIHSKPILQVSVNTMKPRYQYFVSIGGLSSRANLMKQNIRPSGHRLVRKRDF